jgi:hypothetical protein
MHDDAARVGAASALYQECVQELQKPHPDYTKVQALAAVGLMEALREVRGQSGADVPRRAGPAPGCSGPPKGSARATAAPAAVRA